MDSPINRKKQPWQQWPGNEKPAGHGRNGALNPSSSPASPVARLGKNRGGYFGEQIPIETVLNELWRAAGDRGWDREWIQVTETLRLAALHRCGRRVTRRVYLSAGIHGDEPAGPLAACQLVQEDRWPTEAELWICPCLNPEGFLVNRRENRDGRDLNRDYRHLETLETQAHVDWLDQQPRFDLALCLHEDWEAQGFYVYELNPLQQPSLAETMVHRVAQVCPIDLSPVIEDRPADRGIIRPLFDPDSRPLWPEAFYLIHNKTALSYTLEAPSDFPLAARVEALKAAVRAGLANFFQGRLES